MVKWKRFIEHINTQQFKITATCYFAKLLLEIKPAVKQNLLSAIFSMCFPRGWDIIKLL